MLPPTSSLGIRSLSPSSPSSSQFRHPPSNPVAADADTYQADCIFSHGRAFVLLTKRSFSPAHTIRNLPMFQVSVKEGRNEFPDTQWSRFHTPQGTLSLPAETQPGELSPKTLARKK